MKFVWRWCSSVCTERRFLPRKVPDVGKSLHCCAYCCCCCCCCAEAKVTVDGGFSAGRKQRPRPFVWMLNKWIISPQISFSFVRLSAFRYFGINACRPNFPKDMWTTFGSITYREENCPHYEGPAGTYPVLCAYSIFCRKIRFFAFLGDIFLIFGQ